MTSPPRIDSHQHFWRLSRGDYGWLTPALKPIYRDFEPADLAPHLAQHDIASTILVQAAPTEAETHHLLALAAPTPFVAGVVGWTDFEAHDAPARIAALAADPLLVGLRPMAQDIPDPDWLAKPTLAPAFAALKEHGLVFDALVKPPQIPALLTLLERETELPVVIDHGGKPDLTGPDLTAWRGAIPAMDARAARPPRPHPPSPAPPFRRGGATARRGPRGRTRSASSQASSPKPGPAGAKRRWRRPSPN